MQTLSGKSREVSCVKQQSSPVSCHALEAKPKVSKLFALRWTGEWTARILIVWKLGYVCTKRKSKMHRVRLLLVSEEKIKVSSEHWIKQSCEFTVRYLEAMGSWAEVSLASENQEEVYIILAYVFNNFSLLRFFFVFQIE